ncbi:hypothetical protein [Phytohabitans houttuyneae]|uniref:hypothetical protein n=1 Tax=Phytohabitans houttuyneae TaxID=1076126 RepID=UPI0015630AA4|nr:hypothetical protein [Phytohabitans houttuyneae]
MRPFPASVEERLSGLPVEYARSARHLLPPVDALIMDRQHDRLYERVLHALLDLADGDAHQLQEYVEAAERDWRDVLWWAEEPDR